MRIAICLTLALAAGILAGCSQPNLRTGEYRIDRRDRDDFAVVYDDLIFVHIKSPENVPGTLAYWEWAGKYKVRENGEIELGMDHETECRWKFNYQFLRKNDGISFNDWENNTGYMLRYRTPKLKSNAPRPRPAGSTGVDPVYNYRDVSSENVKR
jgi:hypothetical protein